MLNIGKFLHSETSAIGLTSLGLARKIENKTPAQVAQSKTAKQLQQNMNTFSSIQIQSKIQNNEETLNSLFSRNPMLNFNSGKLIG